MLIACEAIAFAWEERREAEGTELHLCHISKDVKVMTMKMLMVGGMRWSVGWSVWRQGSVNRMSLTARDYMSRINGRLPMHA